MIDPTIILQIAIRSRLIATPEVTALVPADHIRAGSTRPDKTPTIILADATLEMHGHGYRYQRLAWIYADLHVWTLDAGVDATRAIAFQTTSALDTPPAMDGCALEHFEVSRVVYPRDPDPAYGHAVISVTALVRWAIDGAELDPADTGTDAPAAPDYVELFEEALD